MVNSSGSLTFIGIHGQKGEGGGVEGSMERNNVSVANRRRDSYISIFISKYYNTGSTVRKLVPEDDVHFLHVISPYLKIFFLFIYEAI